MRFFAPDANSLESPWIPEVRYCYLGAGNMSQGESDGWLQLQPLSEACTVYVVLFEMIQVCHTSACEGSFKHNLFRALKCCLFFILPPLVQIIRSRFITKVVIFSHVAAIIHVRCFGGQFSESPLSIADRPFSWKLGSQPWYQSGEALGGFVKRCNKSMLGCIYITIPCLSLLITLAICLLENVVLCFFGFTFFEHQLEKNDWLPVVVRTAVFPVMGPALEVDVLYDFLKSCFHIFSSTKKGSKKSFCRIRSEFILSSNSSGQIFPGTILWKRPKEWRPWPLST